MFHRVKSDGQNQQGTTAAKQPETPQTPPAGANPFSKPANAASQSSNMFDDVLVETKQAEASVAEKPAEKKEEAKAEKQEAPQSTSQPTQTPPQATTQTTPTTAAKDAKNMTEQDNAQSEKTYGEDRDLPISAYARTGTAPAMSRAPVSAYPGAYPTYGAKPAPVAQDNNSSSDRRLTIGAGITLSGEIESCDYLLVEGTVEAALKGANVLDIAESGVFYGTVEIGEATIAGRFEGDITVHGRLTITASGTVTGSVSYKELAIEAGAVVDGKITPLSAVPAAGKKPANMGKDKPARDARKGENAQEPANSDDGLFSKAAAAAE